MTAALVRNMEFSGKSSFWLGLAKLDSSYYIVDFLRLTTFNTYNSENGRPPCRAKEAVSLEDEVTTSVAEQEMMTMIMAAMVAAPARD